MPDEQSRSSSSQNILALLITVLSVLMGFAAYRSAAIGSTSTDNYFLAQTHLTDANLLYAEQGQEILYDRMAHDQYVLAVEREDEEAAEHYKEQLSEAALAGLSKPDGPFDEDYEKVVYQKARAEVSQEEELFDKAAHDSDRAVAFQLTGLIMSLGTSLAAWASLADEKSRLRTLFMIPTVPNSSILTGQVTNYSNAAGRDELIVHATVTLGYDVPWRQAAELLVEAARKTPSVVDEPGPFVLQTALDGSWVAYQINAYTGEADDLPNLYSALYGNIQDGFNEAGVELMTSQIHALRDGNPSTIPGNYQPEDYKAPGFRLLKL